MRRSSSILPVVVAALNRHFQWLVLFLARFYGTSRDVALIRLFGFYRILILDGVIYVAITRMNSVSVPIFVIGLMLYLVYFFILLRLPVRMYESSLAKTARVYLDIFFITVFLFSFRDFRSDIFFFYGLPLVSAYLYFSLREALFVFFVETLCYGLVCLVFHAQTGVWVSHWVFLHAWLERDFILFVVFVLLFYQDRHARTQGWRFQYAPVGDKGVLQNPLLPFDVARLYEAAGQKHSFLDTILDLTQNALRIYPGSMENHTLAFYLHDRKAGQLVLAAARGYDPEAIGKLWISPGEGVTGKLAEQKTNVRIENLLEDPDFCPSPGRYIFPCIMDLEGLRARYGKISFIGASCLEHGNDLIGVLAASKAIKKGQSDQGFGDSDLHTLRSMGKLVEIAWESRAYYEKLQTISDIMGEVNSASSLEKILSRIARTCCDWLPLRMCTFFEGDESRNVVVLKAIATAPGVNNTEDHIGRIYQADDCFSWEAWHEDREIEVDVEQERRGPGPQKRLELAQRTVSRYVWAIHLRLRGLQRYGVMALGCKDRPLDDIERLTARFLATQAAVAIGLFEKRARELGSFSSLAQDLAQNLSVTHACNRVLKAALEFSKCRNGEILLFEPASAKLRSVVVEGALKNQIAQRPRLIAVSARKGFIRRAARDAEVIRVRDVLEVPNEYMPSYPGSSTRSQLCVPLSGPSERKIIGVLNLEHEDVEHFTGDHEILIGLLCRYVSPLIFNAQQEEQLDAFYELAKDVLFMRSKEELIQAYVSRIPDILKVPVFGIYLWDEARSQYVLANGQGYPADRIAQEGYARGEGRKGQLIEKGIPSVAEWIEEGEKGRFYDYHSEFLETPFLSFLGVPIFGPNHRAFGALEATRPRQYRDHANGFPIGERHLLGLFADLFSVALDNIKSVQKTVETEKEKSDLLSQMARQAAHEIGTPLFAVYHKILRARRELAEDDPMRETCEYARSGLERVEAILQNFRNLTADHPLPMASIDPQEPLKKAIMDCTPFLNEDTAVLDASGIKDVGRIQGNSDALQSLFQNIIKNAIESLPGNAGRVAVTLERSEEGVTINIDDSGQGIPLDVRDSIGKRYFTTKGGRNMGVGLVICDQIIRKHGGRWEFDSTPGKGTRIRIHLPQGGMSDDKRK